jgi:plastocyanin
MTWLLLICSNLSVLTLMASSITGRINVTGEQSHSHKARDCSGVVVWLQPITEAPTMLVHNTPKVRIRQKNKTFSPHILVVPVGTTVDFPNDDPIFHNAFSNYDGQIFDIGLYPPGTTRSITFRRPGVVRIFCNIHAAMSAVVVVVDTPYFAVTGKDGTFQMNGVPKGSYRLTFYDERASDKTLAGVNRTITVNEETQDVGSTDILEANYLAIPHLNKYGKSYGPPPEVTAYPGSQQ